MDMVYFACAWNGRPSKKLDKMLCEHSFCFTFSSALGDIRDHYGNEKKKYAQFLINVSHASNVVVGDYAALTTVRKSPNGGISQIVTLSYFKLVKKNLNRMNYVITITLISTIATW